MITPQNHQPPNILAPAGNQSAFLAALAAGADAIYCGLKQFSARQAAQNFSTESLAELTALAHEKETKVYVAFNSLLKPDDYASATRLLAQIQKRVSPDGLIIQDLGLLQTIRQTRFTGEIHLSTLANVGFPSALKLVRKVLGIDGVVIPRELTIDEIKALAAACPQGMGLEVFIHGALCYAVSGRCYWSSILGGKSGLRGRCVQPCRRIYTHSSKGRKRFFSCQDLGLDVLVKVLLSIPQIRTWKIEGRKKSPHYVYYTVRAYRLLRDHGKDPKMKKAALDLLSQALGRRGTHYHFLPQRPQNPLTHSGHTGSGLLIGKITGTTQKPYFTSREKLLPGDLIRIGYEDQPGHGTFRINRGIPKHGRWYIKPFGYKRPQNGTPVFLTDRREKALDAKLTALEKQLISRRRKMPPSSLSVHLKSQKRYSRKTIHREMFVYRRIKAVDQPQETGIWLHWDNIHQLRRKTVPRPGALKAVWLPPTIWPLEEKGLKEKLQAALSLGCKDFFLNAPWQISLFPSISGLNIWAGPMCNLTNSQALHTIASMGFRGAVISPEMGARDYLQLPATSPLPLGIVVSGNWPLCISRIIPDQVRPEFPFTSPKGEIAWINKNGSEYWMFPNWTLNITSKITQLKAAGYHLLIHLMEPVPNSVSMKARPGMWNWDLNLK